LEEEKTGHNLVIVEYNTYTHTHTHMVRFQALIRLKLNSNQAAGIYLVTQNSVSP
jgi:hypothetical protein